ncbi:MAG: hypothetical protein K0S39_59 [Paenibacillus sp.]|nr:hypothetical protein [Paenibacillus sp.]
MFRAPFPSYFSSYVLQTAAVFFMMLLIVSVTVGCASNNPGAATQAASVKEAAAAAEAGAAYKPAASTDKRTIKHAAGETTLTGTPQKIAVLDYRLADSLLALGLKPIAMTTYLGEINLPYIDGKPLQGTIPLGDTANLEAVLQASPDLIIGRTPEAKIYDQLSKIAPTIIVDIDSKSWRQNFLDLAAYLQREKEANQWLADYDKKAAGIRTEIARYVKPGETFLYLRVMPKEIRVHGIKDLFGATLFQDLQLTPVPGLEKVSRIEPISLEKLPDYNADHIFLQVGTPTAGSNDKNADSHLKTISETPVWKDLKAVKSGHIYTMPHWIISDYPHIKWKSIELILENIKKAPPAK